MADSGGASSSNPTPINPMSGLFGQPVGANPAVGTLHPAISIQHGPQCQSSGCSHGPGPSNDMLGSPVEDPDIFTAAALGHLDQCKKFVEKEGPDLIKSRDGQGNTVAHWAAKNGFVEILEWIHDLGGPLDSPGGPDWRKPIHWACSTGEIRVLHYLLQLESTNPLPDDEKPTGGRVDINGKDKRGYTPIITATQFGQTAAVGYLIHRGGDPKVCDIDGDSPLHWAGYKGNDELTAFLLGYVGLNINQQDVAGMTPLHLAAMNGHESTVRLLVEDQRCDITLRDSKGRDAAALARERQMTRTMYAITGDDTFWGSCANRVFGERTYIPFSINCFHIVFGYVLLYGWCMDLLPGYGVLHALTTVLPACMAYSLYLAHVTDPGYIPKGTASHKWGDDESHPHHVEGTRHGSEEYELALKKIADTGHLDSSVLQLCHSCGIVRPRRSKHCRICQRCVNRFDHHCPFVYNCIGVGNQAYFFTYLIFATPSILLFMIELGLGLWAPTAPRDPSSRVNIFLLIWFIIYAFWGTCILGLTFVQVRQVIANITTNEYMNLHKYRYLKDEMGRYRNPFDKGCIKNLMEFYSAVNPFERKRARDNRGDYSAVEMV